MPEGTQGVVRALSRLAVDPDLAIAWQLVGSRALLLSVPFVLYGIFRYLFLVYSADRGGDPTRTIFTDVPLLITGGLWAALCTAAILFGKTWLAILA